MKELAEVKMGHDGSLLFWVLFCGGGSVSTVCRLNLGEFSNSDSSSSGRTGA